MALLATLVAGVLCGAIANAGPTAPDQDAVLRVGQSSLGLDELQRRLDTIPSFQLATLGKTPSAIREGFVNEVVVPELLLSQEADARKLRETPQVRQLTRQLLARALEDSIRRQAEQAIINDDAVAKYFDGHRAEYGRPERVRLFRLLVASRAQAEQLLAKAKQLKDMGEWRNLVREHSLDKATSMRSGDLGFVTADGNTDVPRVRVAPSLFEAARAVKDGELVPEPVPEGKRFAVVWRRGSVGAVEPTLADEAPRIRRRLIEERVRTNLDALVRERTHSDVERRDLTILEELSLSVPEDPRAAASVGLVPQPHAAKPDVRRGESGLR